MLVTVFVTSLGGLDEREMVRKRMVKRGNVINEKYSLFKNNSGNLQWRTDIAVLFPDLPFGKRGGNWGAPLKIGSGFVYRT